jgi:hypothetical protein
MVALFWVLADEDRRIERALLAFAILLAAVLVGIILIKLAERWRKQPFQARMSASEQLAVFREQFEKGQIKPEEFERIRTLLNERIRQEMEVSAAPTTPTSGEKSEKSSPPESPDSRFQPGDSS